VIEAIKRFLAFCEKPPQDAHARQIGLSRAVDDLLCAYHSAPEIAFDERDFSEPPDSSVRFDFEGLAQNFSDLGYYHVVMPAPPDCQADLMVGDAMDDLHDIIADLSEIVWRWQETSEADAIWHLRLSFEHHWGRHAVNLRSYLHGRLFEDR